MYLDNCLSRVHVRRYLLYNIDNYSCCAVFPFTDLIKISSELFNKDLQLTPSSHVGPSSPPIFTEEICSGKFSRFTFMGILCFVKNYLIETKTNVH